VVFDLDDTLYLERDYVRSGFCAVGRHLSGRQGLQGFASVAWREFGAGRRGDIFDRVLAVLGRHPDEGLVRELVEVYRNHQPAIVLEPDALDFLDALSETIKLALVTDGPLASQRAKVSALQLDRWIPTRVFTAELGEGLGKPHPRAFESVQDRTGCRGDSCVYVADNPEKDFQGPRSLGWRTFRCRRKMGLHAGVDDGAPVDLSASDLSGLSDFLTGSG